MYEAIFNATRQVQHGLQLAVLDFNFSRPAFGTHLQNLVFVEFSNQKVVSQMMHE
jgi:hypothetical protein